MSARTKPTNLPRRKLDEARERDPGRQVVVRHRTVDSIGKMMHAGTITPAMHDAARSFQTDFALAGLDPLRARPMMLPCGAHLAPQMTECQIDARRRVHEALDALGGLNSLPARRRGTSWAAVARLGSGRCAEAGVDSPCGRSKHKGF